MNVMERKNVAEGVIPLNKEMLDLEIMLVGFLEKHAKTKDDLEKLSPMLHDAIESAVVDFIENQLSIDPDSDVGDYDPVW